MGRWEIMRHWSIIDDTGAAKEIETAQLSDYGACILLGAAGIGKTSEMNFLCELEKKLGFDVQFKRLALLATSSDRLDGGLTSILQGATEKTVIYLDAFDEAMVPLPTIALNIATWIRQGLKSSKARLRISSRSAVWPRTLEASIKEAYGSTVVTASLNSLSLDDIKAAASAFDVKFEDFWRSIVQKGAVPLAQHPLTLEMLLRINKEEKKLPSNRKTLFEKGTMLYAHERDERREVGTAGKFQPKEIIEAAERLACFLLLSGREIVDTGDQPDETSLGLSELLQLPGEPSLQEGLIKAVGGSGLCESAGGVKNFRFAHRQFAEFLVGRRLAKLLPHQWIALFASGNLGKSSVAGPLRETASFAAMHNEELADWIVENDPEVIGLSDVADDKLRRRGMLKYLDRFRRYEIAASQIKWGDANFWGFRNPKAESDLRAALREQGKNCQNLLQCAIEFCERWELASLSEDLTDLVLDENAPFIARKSAGYALKHFGTEQARSRLKVLAGGIPSDVDDDLKGLALQCNWPGNLTVLELLPTLTSRKNKSYVGSYEAFLYELDRNNFSSHGFRLEGLIWARQFINGDSDFDPLTRIARRIARAAVNEIENDEVAEALVRLLLEAKHSYAKSPLRSLRDKTTSMSEDAKEEPSPLLGKPNARRRIIELLVSLSQPEDHIYLWQIGFDTPDLSIVEDFEWLIGRATDLARPEPHRIIYGDFATALPWDRHSANLDLWLSLHDRIPKRSRLYEPLWVEIDSEEAKNARKVLAQIRELSKPRKVPKVRPAPQTRVKQVLELCETRTPQNFYGLSQELTLKPDSTHYEFERFLSRSPGWLAADEKTRERILSAAKRFLEIEIDAPEQIRSEPMNSIHSGCMAAIWLAMESDRTWLEARPSDWWSRWALYILRETHFNMSGEPEEPKRELLQLLHKNAASDFRSVIIGLATLTGQDSFHTLSALLNSVDFIPDTDLDRQLAELLSNHCIPADRIGIVAEFVLGRDKERSLSICVGLMDRKAASADAEIAIRAAIALLIERTSEAWDSVLKFLIERRDLAPRIISEFAQNYRLRYRAGEIPAGLSQLTTVQIGQFICLLLDFFPPPSDPDYDGAHFVGPEESARTLRSQLISWLGDQKSADAVLAWRQILEKFGSTYPWLQDLRLRAEQTYRLSQWSPIPPVSIAAIFEASKKRLIRSEADALEGVIHTIKAFGSALHRESHNKLENLWNTDGKHPSPKDEEHISDSICDEIKRYFEQYAVTAGREVQVFRRKVPASLGGEPGSEVDVLVDIPAVGTSIDEPIKVPIEIKLSRNSETKTGLRDQLVNRYMRQLGTNVGVFVVVWMQAPNLLSKDKPVWSSLGKARAALEQQAKKVNAPGTLTINAFILDASLSAFTSKKKIKKHQRKSKAIKKNTNTTKKKK